jgi:hypothetical protein
MTPTPAFTRLAKLTASFLALSCFTLAAQAAETRITGPSPFANCTADDVAGQEGTNYPNAEVEPWVSVNPRNQKNLVAAWQQDRWSNGGSRGLAAGYSLDRGKSWTTVVPQGTTKCAGGPFDRASDPWTTISPNGVAYFMSLGFMKDEVCANGSITNGDNAMTVNQSTDGGRTWGAAMMLDFDTDGQIFNDKNAMTADPFNNRFVYASWDKLIDFTVVSSCEVASVARVQLASTGDVGGGPIARNGDGVEMARERLRNKRNAASSRSAAAADPVVVIYTGPSYFVRTTNGGQSWEPEKMIFDTGPNAQTINNLIEVLPNRTLLNFFTNLPADGSVQLGYVRSFDRGATFGPLKIAFDMNVTLNATITPDAEEPVRDANILFDSAVDPKNGNIYVVWQDGRVGDIDRVAFSMSRNSGNSWTEPVIINKTPASSNPLREQAFIPSVEVDGEGKVFVTYYDFRNDVDDGRELTDYWAIQCDGRKGTACANARNWEDEQRLTDKSFDMLNAPVARGHFLGDYQGLVRAGEKVTSVHGEAVGPNLNDMFSIVLDD